MYLLATHIPVLVDGPRLYLDQGWYPDVLLARDWLARPFGGLTLIAPWRPVEGDASGLHELGPDTGIRAVPVSDERSRARRFWLHDRRTWIDTVRRELPGASVLHASMDDMYRPMAQLAFREAVRAGVPTVLVGPDMDPHEVWAEELAHGSWPGRLEKRIYLRAFDRAFGRYLAEADLSLLKEGAVHDRYAGRARNPRLFCHAMYRQEDVIPEADLERRLASRREGDPLRLVYFGRWVRRKGLHVSLGIVERLRARGTPVLLDVIGGGPEEASLRAQVEARSLGELVRFHPAVPYGPELLRRLAVHDALLFTPTEEDTPRMVYDAYAAGLPFIGTAIPFLRVRARMDGAGLLFPVDDEEGGARELAALAADPGRRAALSRRARQAGLEHAVERWFARRAEWTAEAVERRRGARAGGAGRA
jgi:glycosyltransferase involved in cell wall biosynthesis